MRLFWVFLLAIIIVGALYFSIHRLLINRATIMLRRRAQETTDAAVNATLDKLLHWNQHLDSQLVADVWGKGVLAFEYHFDYRNLQVDLTTFKRVQVEQGLIQYAKQHQLKAMGDHQPVFVVTDWWTYEGILHVDVAYLLNEATVEYVADLDKLSHHNG